MGSFSLARMRNQQRPSGIALVILTRNEAETIGDRIRKALLFSRAVILVDDDSSDATAQVAAEAGAVVICRHAQRPLQESLSLGMRIAAEFGGRVEVENDLPDWLPFPERERLPS